MMTIELTEREYASLIALAKASKQTPEDWIAAQISWRLLTQRSNESRIAIGLPMEGIGN